MKEIIILIIVLCLVFIPNISFRKYLHHSGQEIVQIAKELQNSLEQGMINPENALKLKEEFEKKEKVWILIVDHDMLDEIEYEIENCVAFYTIDNKQDFISAVSRLIDEIEDLSKREEISMANIL